MGSKGKASRLPPLVPQLKHDVPFGFAGLSMVRRCSKVSSSYTSARVCSTATSLRARPSMWLAIVSAAPQPACVHVHRCGLPLCLQHRNQPACTSINVACHCAAEVPLPKSVQAKRVQKFWPLACTCTADGRCVHNRAHVTHATPLKIKISFLSIHPPRHRGEKVL